jgi:hypothetical protein
MRHHCHCNWRTAMTSCMRAWLVSRARKDDSDWMPAKPKPFWYPLALWQVLLWFLLANVVGFVIVIALREGLKLDLPPWVGGGIGGMLGVFLVGAAARRKQKS